MSHSPLMKYSRAMSVEKGDGRKNSCFEAKLDLGLGAKAQGCEAHFLQVSLQSQVSP